jgi:hypothetical protein
MRTAKHVENQVNSDSQNLLQIHSFGTGACDGDVRTRKATEGDDLNGFIDAQKFHFQIVHF